MATFKPTPKWPSALRNLVTRDLHVQTGKYSVTGLITPPRLAQLRKRYDAQIELDPDDRIWMLFGTLVHKQLEEAAGKNALTEELLTVNVNGVKVSGSADVWEDGVLCDFKTTSAYSVKSGLKPEWTKQLSMYALMYRNQGFTVRSAIITAILRDWSKTTAMRDASYPQKRVCIIDVPLMSNADTLAYMEERVAIHEAAESMADDELPKCTAEERWERPAKYAVMKKGRKSAVKLHDSEFEAQVFIDGIEKDKEKHYIEFRKGESIRCEGYCEVCGFCNQYKAMQEEK